MIVRRRGRSEYELIGRCGVGIGLDESQVRRLRELDALSIRQLEGDPVLAPVAGAVRYLFDSEEGTEAAIHQLQESIPAI